MLINIHRNHKAYLGWGEKEWRGYGGGGKREIIYLSLHCHHQNDSCIKMRSDESHFNVSLGSDGQSHRTVSTTHNHFEEKEEPKQYQTKVLLLTSLTPYCWAKLANSFSMACPDLTLKYTLFYLLSFFRIRQRVAAKEERAAKVRQQMKRIQQ